MKICGELVLAKGSKINLMPYCLHLDTPYWIVQFSTSRIIAADNGHGFLIDCGGKNQFEYVKKLPEKGVIKQIDGIFVTHTHDDYSHMVKAAAEYFNCSAFDSLKKLTYLETQYNKRTKILRDLFTGRYKLWDR